MSVAQTVVFVSPEGRDNGRGSAKSPFRTVERALAETRKSSARESVIYLREGTYRLSEPLVLTPADSNLTISSCRGERAVISGAELLEPVWRPWKEGICVASVKSTGAMDVLTVDGTVRPMARYPDYDSTAVRLGGTAADADSPERVARWKNPRGGYLHAMHSHDWGDFHFRIAGAESGKLKLEGGWQNNRRSGLHRQNRMVENIFEELDAPGEWFYDTADGLLYYYPLPGEDPAGALFEAARLKHLVELRGTSQNPVRNVSIVGVEFCGTARTFMEHYEPLLRSDWTIYRGGAIVLEGTEDCSIRCCDMQNLGGNAVFFSGYNRRSSVSGCHIRNVGASAVCFVGRPEAVRSPSFEYGKSVPANLLDRTPGPCGEEYPAHCVMYDNLIHHIGFCEKQVAGAQISMSSHITVSHNTIYRTPRAGINIGDGTWGGHVVEDNDVFETVLETGDHGAFNSWGRDRFWRSSYKEMTELVAAEPSLARADATDRTVLRHNRFRCDRGWDIDLDDGSSNYLICDNLCLNGGIKLREGFYRTVTNNILLNSTFHPHVWFRGSGDVFTRNIVMRPYRPIGIAEWGAEVDYNIFVDSTALASARARGTDSHSAVRVVKFRNPAEGDYRMEDAGAIARICGFSDFRTDDFGVVSPRLKALAAEPLMPYPITAAGDDDVVMVDWSGLLLKNLETPGERSATGMDSERGVYVVTVQVMGNPLRDFVRSNDVILGFGGEKIDNLDDLRRAVAASDLSSDQELEIFRDQCSRKMTIPGGTIKLKL